MKESLVMHKVPEICLIAPSQHLARLTEKIAKERGEEIGIYVGALDEGLRWARELSTQGAKIFVSRKGTAALLSKHDFAVAYINTTLNDYLRHLHSMKEHKGKIAIVEYEEFVPELTQMCQYLGVSDTEIYGYTNVINYEEAVEKAINNKAEIVMGGGAILPGLAKDRGIPHTVVENTPQSIHMALDAANQLLRVQKQEAEKQKHFKIQLEKYTTIVNYNHDAIINTDENGIIAIVNENALKLLGLDGSIIGQSIMKVVPELEFETLKVKQERKINRVIDINKILVSVNQLPIIVNQKFEGTVYVIQNIKDIQKSEEKIRLQLYKKGHVAKYNFDDIIGTSPAIKRAKQIAFNYAPADSSVLITGETGTGKEMFAQSIHKNSTRKHGPFVAINCAALPKDLLVSQLFGYEEGTFTGAVKGGKAGIFEIAHGGTIFLDEIGEIPMETQIQLLRVLQEKEVRRLSSDKVIPINVRVICATNRDLAEEVREKRFRMDLFYRINVLKLTIPPLRERTEDIPLIANNFLKELSISKPEKVTTYLDALYPQISNYTWPGNARELLGIVERVAILLKQDSSMDIGLDMILENIEEKHAATPEVKEEKERWQKTQILQALQENAYHKGKTAQALGISRSTLWRLISQYQIK